MPVERSDGSDIYDVLCGDAPVGKPVERKNDSHSAGDDEACEHGNGTLFDHQIPEHVGTLGCPQA